MEQGGLSSCTLLFTWSEEPELGRTGLVCWYKVPKSALSVLQTEYSHLAQPVYVCSTAGQLFQVCKLHLLSQLGSSLQVSRA